MISERGSKRQPYSISGRCAGAENLFRLVFGALLAETLETASEALLDAPYLALPAI